MLWAHAKILNHAVTIAAQHQQMNSDRKAAAVPDNRVKFFHSNCSATMQRLHIVYVLCVLDSCVSSESKLPATMLV